MRRLLEWKYMNPPASNATTSNTTTNNFPSQEERYKKLVAQVEAENKYNCYTNLLTDRLLVLTLSELNNTSKKVADIKLIYKPYTSPPVYHLTVSGLQATYSDWNDILETLKINNILTNISSLTEAINSSIPTKLYHATYKQFLESIKEKGLGNTKKKMWSDSKLGVVYLAADPWTAESYAEESEWLDSVATPDDYIDNIIILEVDTTKLDSSKFYIDENVLLDDGEENSTWEYYGVIPWEAINIFNSTAADDFEVYNNLWEN